MGPSSNSRRAVNPFMVQVGRESRGLSQKELAEAVGVTQGRISKIEAGMLPVPGELLEMLSSTLDYPPHFFLQEGSIMGIGLAEVFHRKRADVPKRLLDKIHAQMEIRRRHVEQLLRATEFPVRVPRLDLEDYRDSPEEVARLVRATWHLPRGPVQNLTETLEQAGVVIVPFDFETTRVDAISRWVPGLPPLMFVNDLSPTDRRRFSLAHELGHMVMHALPTPEIEPQADRFAAEFLMPARDIRVDLRDVTLQRLAQLKPYWKVAMQAILKRAQDLGTITATRARSLWSQMARLGYRTREPSEYDLPAEEPRLLRELIETHIQDLGYSADDLRKLLALNEVELWSFYLREQSQPPPLKVVPQALRLAR